MKLKEIKPGMVIHYKNDEEKKLLLEELERLGYVWYASNALPTELVKNSALGVVIHVYDKGFKYITHSLQVESVTHEFSDLILPETMTEEEAYKKGREDAFEEVRNCEGYGYDCGLKDSWELAKKIINKDWTFADARDCFGLDVNLKTGVEVTREIFNIPYYEALARFEAYEKEKEIKQWDVVEYGRNNTKILVTEINEETFSGIKITPTDEFGKFGGVYSARNLTDCKKANYKADLSAILAEIGKE